MDAIGAALFWFATILILWVIDSRLDRIAKALESVSDQLAQEYKGDDPEAS